MILCWATFTAIVGCMWPTGCRLDTPATRLKRNSDSCAQSKIFSLALADVAQWVGCHPVKQKVTGSAPSQDTCLGCRLGPQLGGVTRGCSDKYTGVYLPLFLPPFPSF